jgi:hypothetical protein
MTGNETSLCLDFSRSISAVTLWHASTILYWKMNFTCNIDDLHMLQKAKPSGRWAPLYCSPSTILLSRNKI